MMWVAAILGLVVMVLAVAVWLLSVNDNVKISGQPTPQEAKIEAETAQRAREIVNQGDEEKTEVLNADRNGLLARLRDRVRGK